MTGLAGSGDGLAERVLRSDLEGRPARTLSRGGWGNPDVRVVDTARGPVVVKDFAPRHRFVRTWLGPWLVDRELAAYGRLADVDAVPAVVGRVAPEAFAVEYRPGTLLSRSLRGKLPPGFLDELEAAVRAMHARGVVHLDLRHRSNVLAGEDGRPVLIDFASALRFDPSRPWGRLAVRLFGWVDRRAVRKWRRKLGEGSGAAQDSGAGSSAGSRGASRPM